MNHADAQDVVQETFLAVHQGLDSFRGESAVYTWIYRIALNEIHRHSQSAGREIAGMITEDGETNGVPLPEGLTDRETPEREYIFREVEGEIRERCHSFLTFLLTPEQKSVFLLRELLDLSYREIAEILDLDENVVRSRLKRARDVLSRRLTRDCSWINPEGKCSCRTKVGYVLKKYPGLLQKYLHRMPRDRAAGLVETALEKSPMTIHEIFRKLPEVEYKIRPLFPGEP